MGVAGGAYGPTARDQYAATVWRADQENFQFNSMSTVTVTGLSGGVAAADNKAFASIFTVSRLLKVSGFQLGQITKLAGAGAGIDVNAGIWTAVSDGANNWSPSALVTGAEGIMAMTISTANEMNWGATFAATVVIPPGNYFLAGCYRFNNTVSGGAFKTLVGSRGNLLGEPVAEGRYDLNSVANVTYTTGTIAALFAAATWVSVASGSMASVNWALRCEQ